jgi:predicted peroxiredoxin
MPGFTTRRVLSAAERTAKQLRRSQEAAPDWLKGALNPSKNPVEEMRKAGGRYAAGVQKAVQDKSYDSGVAAIDESEMVERIQAAGSQAFAQGVARAEKAIARTNEQMQPILERNLATLDAMPTDTPQQRIAKMVKNVELQTAMGQQLRGAK